MNTLRLLAMSLALLGVGGAARGEVVRIVLDGAVDPVRAEFIVAAMQEADQQKAALIVLEMDTPGGLGDSMKAIIRAILNGRTPVAAFVTPSGAHAASAGFFILVAADVAAMAPGTNSGAAHPIMAFGGVMPIPEDEKTKPIFEKIQNDILAYLRGIVRQRGRNEEAAVAAVKQNASYTAAEALDAKLIDLVAKDEAELLKLLDGRTVRKFDGREVVLKLTGQTVRLVEMSLRQRMLAFVSDPNVAIILALVGILGLFFEFSHPGFYAPGVVGGICLLLALLGFSLLPLNYVGVLLIIVAVALFIAEIKVQGFGVLGIAGIVSLVLGFLMLVESPDPNFGVAWSVVLGVAVPVGVLLLLLTRLVIGAMRSRSATGQEGMAGIAGRSVTELAPAGQVHVRGEYWNAVSASGAAIPADTPVVVIRAEGLVLYVEPRDKNTTQGGQL
ncbi:MAG TPA: nodulation protein NfeD [Acidobacteriota bacterium]|nr:nodulation protein NfeD [Acidobacteriota bacterium]HQF88317.1 nodulation protein NfeD [Acidobacteriota bacterium]HQG93023.1 nodulation protein NfeD [Acidobacteriota bacterium]HQK86314.1 nodulation protein NfeD [Acidobacteriota bacterium]